MLSQLMSRAFLVLRSLVVKAKNEPLVLLNVLAGAFAAGAAAAADVENKSIAALVAAGAVLTVLERQLVRPEGKAKAQDEYTQWLEEKSFSDSEFFDVEDLESDGDLLDELLKQVDLLDDEDEDEVFDLDDLFRGDLDEEE